MKTCGASIGSNSPLSGTTWLIFCYSFRFSLGKLRNRDAGWVSPTAGHSSPPDLRSDYNEMKAMIFGAYPEWDEIIEGLYALERRINDMN